MSDCDADEAPNTGGRGSKNSRQFHPGRMMPLGKKPTILLLAQQYSALRNPQMDDPIGCCLGFVLPAADVHLFHQFFVSICTIFLESVSSVINGIT
jgi:hypothetical protein